MWIYVIELYDSGIERAFKTSEKAHEALWEFYLDLVDADSRAKINEYSGKTYEQEDRASLEDYGYIDCFGGITETWLEVGK